MKGKRIYSEWMKGIILSIFIFQFSFLMTGCRPKGILHSWELRALLYDLHRMDALLQVSGKQYESDEVRNIYYAAVLEKHGVTQAQFDSSLVWYTAHPQLFDKIYPKVIARLMEDEQQFEAAHAAELEGNGLADEGVSGLVDEGVSGLVDERVSGLVDERVSGLVDERVLDSTLWVTQNGYPTTWNPLVHNLKNQLFPQIGVLR